jgi:hypothetical protein
MDDDFSAFSTSVFASVAHPDGLCASHSVPFDLRHLPGRFLNAN